MTCQYFNPAQNSFPFSIGILITLTLLLPHSSLENGRSMSKMLSFSIQRQIGID
ncbi:hypothetical protein CV_0026 [Chromobacterium violaceum ATCC 12472]|uniref:Uncharacterized protein n=1 Tax=Chromobacterium violaceum (strain ATCC 12472 / DSM 30191 / JCM 1249 / CCUG 213 / NBRC 12614 / NCIMB 9131 / NCTC 9757 / MK) TaxID=243365 RepID=Q7P235_CHRVO|nr:hypothetical protein CV_0026 [Chromobacterium violaceum ATCC 12472]